MAIYTLEAIEAGSTTQWIRVRGADAANPCAFGDPARSGLAMINEARCFEHVLGLEQAFTVVYWDSAAAAARPRSREPA
jgi:hypothetical protein